KQATLKKRLKIGKRLDITIVDNDLVQKVIAKQMNRTPSAIAHLKNDDIPLQFDDIEALLNATGKNNQFLAMEIAHQMVGITVPAIDGSKVMKEPLAMAVKTMPELTQALEAIQQSMDELTIPKQELSEKDFKDPEKLVFECY